MGEDSVGPSRASFTFGSMKLILSVHSWHLTKSEFDRRCDQRTVNRTSGMFFRGSGCFRLRSACGDSGRQRRCSGLYEDRSFVRSVQKALAQIGESLLQIIA